MLDTEIEAKHGPRRCHARPGDARITFKMEPRPAPSYPPSNKRLSRTPNGWLQSSLVGYGHSPKGLGPGRRFGAGQARFVGRHDPLEGVSLSRVLLTIAIVPGLVALYAGAHLALIELGGEVVILHKWISDSETRQTRLWIVDDAEGAWFHHGTSESAWIQRLESFPVVTVERGGATRSYRARPDRERHDLVHRLLREQYGFADWWVRFVTRTAKKCPALPVRLEEVES